MSRDFLTSEVGRAVSILTTGRGRVLERLASVRDEVFNHLERDDIPTLHTREIFDQIVTGLNQIDALTEDEGKSVAVLIEDLSAIVSAREV